MLRDGDFLRETRRKRAQEVAVPVTQKDLAEMGAACEERSAGKVS